MPVPPCPTLVASILPADFACLGAGVRDLERAGVDRIQSDVMDGHFVPNLTFGPDVIGATRGLVDLERADAERAGAERADAERAGAERADAERAEAERADAERAGAPAGTDDHGRGPGA